MSVDPRHRLLELPVVANLVFVLFCTFYGTLVFVVFILAQLKFKKKIIALVNWSDFIS